MLVMICGRCLHVNGIDPGFVPEVGWQILCRRCNEPHDVLSVNPFSVLMKTPMAVQGEEGGG